MSCVLAACGRAQEPAAIGPDGGVISADASPAIADADAAATIADAEPVADASPPPVAWYYPPLAGDAWETVDPAAAGWDSARLDEALEFAGGLHATAVIVLYRGRILAERYWQGWDLPQPIPHRHGHERRRGRW